MKRSERRATSGVQAPRHHGISSREKRAPHAIDTERHGLQNPVTVWRSVEPACRCGAACFVRFRACKQSSSAFFFSSFHFSRRTQHTVGKTHTSMLVNGFADAVILKIDQKTWFRMCRCTCSTGMWAWWTAEAATTTFLGGKSPQAGSGGHLEWQKVFAARPVSLLYGENSFGDFLDGDDGNKYGSSLLVVILYLTSIVYITPALQRLYSTSTRICPKVCAPRSSCKVCTLTSYSMVDWLICSTLPVFLFHFLLGNHFTFRLHFCFNTKHDYYAHRKAGVGRVWSVCFREVSIFKVHRLWSKNEVRRLWGNHPSYSIMGVHRHRSNNGSAQTLRHCPRTQSINQPSNNMEVRRLCSKNGVRRLWGISSYWVL